MVGPIIKAPKLIIKAPKLIIKAPKLIIKAPKLIIKTPKVIKMKRPPTGAGARKGGSKKR